MTNLWEVNEMNTALYDYAKKLRLGKDFSMFVTVNIEFIFAISSGENS